MAQFDFPRLHFSGKCSIDPATANNGWYMPLVIFEPIRIEAVCPPRVYLEDQYLLNGKTLDDIAKLLPQEAKIQIEYEGAYRGVPYVEIVPINSDAIFRDWASVPLGNYSLDKDYTDLYDAVGPSSAGTTSLIGSVPGYWNYYGTMQYKYIEVSVKRAVTGYSNGEYQSYGVESPDTPEVIQQLLGAELNMNSRHGDNSSNSAVMVDLLPTMAMYSQIFCDHLNLVKDQKHLFSGKPYKASLRVVNSFRVVNENMPQGASGVFFSAIPLHELKPHKDNEILNFIEAYRDKTRKLKGIFIQQMISEVEEIREVDYGTVGKISNPAYANVGGTISPWYEEDLLNWPECRQMIGVAPFLTHSSPKFMAPIAMMTPTIFKVDEKNNVLHLDFLNNFPVINTTSDSQDPLEPRPDEVNTYETYELGEVELYLDYKSTKDADSEIISLGKFDINNDTWPQERYYTEGGIIAFDLNGIPNLTQEKLANGDVKMNWNSSNGPVPLLAESPMIYTSEQCGMYTNVNDDPMHGFRSNSSEKEKCVLRMFKRGVPCKVPTPVCIIEIRMAYGGSQKSEKVFRKDYYKDGDILIFPNAEASNAMYLFSDINEQDPLPPQYPLEVVKTGFYINLKVLPKHDYSKYFNKNHPDYQETITFDVLYKEIFHCYSLITPVMRFSAASWENEHLAQLLVEKTHPKNWASSGYMPISRDLSEDQRQLIYKWAYSFKKLDKSFPMTMLFEELNKLESVEKLKQIQFFNK